MREVAVIAGGQSAFGSFPQMSIKELFLAAYEDMLASIPNVEPPHLAGLIEAVYVGTLGCGGFQIGQSAPLLAKEAGLGDIPCVRVENACASGGFALQQGIIAVASGLYDLVLVAGVEKMCDLSANKIRYWLGVSGDTEYERLAGLTFAGIYALMANRYLYDYKLKREVLSQVAVKNHENGSHNPKAQFPRKITLEQAVNAPMVADPLNIFDCSPITDGAAVVLLGTIELARRFNTGFLKVAGFGAGSDALAVFNRKSITSLEASVKAAQSAYAMAGIGPRDIDIAEVHDCFTIAELIAYEDLGFCPRGKAALLLEKGETFRNGRLPVNASGGLKSKGHPLGATGVGQVVELLKQFYGKAEGKRQVPKELRYGLTHNVGGSGGTAAVTILTKEQ